MNNLLENFFMKLITDLAILFIWGVLTMGCATTGQKTSYEASGIISRFLTTSDGSVDGFIFQDGMQIRFPSHMSTIVTDNIAVGDEVTVKGEESTTNSMWAHQMITSKNANEIEVTREAKGKMLASKRERETAFKEVSNMVVRLPVDIIRPTRAYDIGQYVEASTVQRQADVYEIDYE